ncbi:MAG: hypothetical protein WC679_13385 [Bacteroidales bacterium]
MNNLIVYIMNIIMYIFFPIFIFDNVKFKEIKSRRYNNDRFYKYNISNWQAALFLYEQANKRIELLQTKLGGLLTIQSILIGLFSIINVVADKYSKVLVLVCIIMSFIGIIFSIAPLTISTSKVVNLEKYIKFNKTTKNEFNEAIIDLGCRADFYADCLKTSNTIILLSMIIFVLSLTITNPIENSNRKNNKEINSFKYDNSNSVLEQYIKKYQYNNNSYLKK